MCSLTKLHLTVPQSRASVVLFLEFFIEQKKSSASWLCDELCSQLCEIIFPCCWEMSSHKVAPAGVTKPRKRGIIFRILH